METDYSDLIMQLRGLLADERQLIPNLANASAFIFSTLPDLNWAGFYLMSNGELLLGPFQGKPACIHIPVGKGVCGTAAVKNQTMRIANVHDFPGHIACDGASASEIVIPMRANGKIVGVLDVDSPRINRFSENDQAGLEAFSAIIESACDWK